jgi:hypothetical protein
VDYVQNQYKPFEFGEQAKVIGQMSDDDAAEQLGVNRVTIARWRARHNVKPYTPIDLSDYVHLYGDLTDGEIARIAGVSREMVRKDREARSIAGRPVGRPTKAMHDLWTTAAQASRADLRVMVEASDAEADHAYRVYVLRAGQELDHAFAENEAAAQALIEQLAQKHSQDDD